MDETGSPITILITGLRRGGAETQAVRLALALTRRGWRCRLISLVEGNDYAAELEGSGVHWESFGMWSGRQALPALVRLRRELRDHKPRVLLTFMFHANVLGRLAAWGLGVPAVIGSIRSEHFGGAGRDRLLRWTDRLGHRMTTNSRTVAERLVRRKVVPARRLTVVPNATVLAEPSPPGPEREATRREGGCGPDEIVWLAAGRLTAPKDYPGLLDAFALVAARVDRARLWIAGAGELEATIRDRISRLELGDRVTLLGMRRDLPRWLRAADAFVLSSSWEGLPNVVLEAAATGLPIVSTRVGGVPEILGDEAPWLCPPHDPRALARAMEEVSNLAADDRARHGAAGRRRIASEFAEEVVVERWLALFEEVLAGRGS